MKFTVFDRNDLLTIKDGFILINPNNGLEKIRSLKKR